MSEPPRCPFCWSKQVMLSSEPLWMVETVETSMIRARVTRAVRRCRCRKCDTQWSSPLAEQSGCRVS